MPRNALVGSLLAVAFVGFPARSAVAQGSLAPQQIPPLKAATIYIKVQAGGLGATGSGFLVKRDGTTGYIVTNFHVIDLSKGPGGVPNPGGMNTVIKAVFDSGSGKDRVVAAVPVALDPEHDLAVLRVVGVNDLPEPIDLANPPVLLETMPVFVCGFPFGEQLGEADRNPAISIGPASVSSIRNDAAGRINRVQLNGALNPGNSGGPVVTADGKLVGVAVTTIKGAGIGFAVPHQQVTALLKGRSGIPKLKPMAGEANLKLEVPVMDPYGLVTAAAVYVRPLGEAMPKGDPENPALLADAVKVPLAVVNGIGTAMIEPPAEGQRSLVVQVELTTAAGTIRSLPAEVRLSAPAEGAGKPPVRPMPGPSSPDAPLLPPPTERYPTAKPGITELSELNRSPEKFIGKSIQTDVLSFGGLTVRDGGFELDVSLESGKSPSTVRVVLAKDLGLQLSDLGLPPGENYALRLTGLLQKPGGKYDNKHTLEAKELAFLAQSGEPVFTLKPAESAPSGPITLAAMNRFPESFRGQAITIDALFIGIGSAGQGYEVKVMNENEVAPLNLEFYTSKAMATQAEDELPRGVMLVRLSGNLERVSAKTGKGIVAVNKIEVFNPRGNTVVKTLNAGGTIPLPVESAPPPPKAATPPSKPAADSAAKAEAKTNWVLVGGLAVGAVIFVGLGVGGVVFVLVLRGKKAKEADADSDREAPAKVEPTAKAKPAKKEKPKVDDGVEFPGFGE